MGFAKQCEGRRYQPERPERVFEDRDVGSHGDKLEGKREIYLSPRLLWCN
jgi:hypothetical protein